MQSGSVMRSGRTRGEGMRLTLLGTGDAIGTPKIGCGCATCTLAREEGRQRLRTSLLVQSDGGSVLIDTSPDLRMQLLSNGSPHIDAVIWTHGHYDHFAGYAEFYRVQKMPPAYASEGVGCYIADQLHFLPLETVCREPFVPFELFGVSYTLVPVNHPPVEAYGLVLERNGTKIAYTGDTRRDIPPKSLELMQGCDLLFADAIMPGHIHIGKHMNYTEACSLAEELEAKDFRCVHMSHKISWETPKIGTDGEVFDF